jgi:hypothetical protein
MEIIMKRLFIFLCLFLRSEMLLATAAENPPDHRTAEPKRSALKKTGKILAGEPKHIRINDTVDVCCFDAREPKRAPQFNSQIIVPGTEDGATTALPRWQTRAEAAAVPHEDGRGDGYIPSHGVRLNSFAAHKEAEAKKKAKKAKMIKNQVIQGKTLRGRLFKISAIRRKETAMK